MSASFCEKEIQSSVWVVVEEATFRGRDIFGIRDEQIHTIAYKTDKQQGLLDSQGARLDTLQ